MQTKQNANFLQLFPHKHPLPHHPSHTTMNLLGPILYKFPPGWPGITQDESNEVLKSIEM